jgi:hypothetical protein
MNRDHGVTELASYDEGAFDDHQLLLGAVDDYCAP